MEFVEHSIAWCRGEIFEGRMIAVFGVLVSLAALAFWRFGTTPFGKALFIPWLIFGLACIAGGFYMQNSNQQRIKTYTESFKEDPDAFVQSEKARAENFIRWYPITMYTTAALMIGGLACYLFWGGAWGRSIGLTILLIGLAVLVIDHFSEERAHTYYGHIEARLST